VTVRGGYSPDLIRVRQGAPVELVSDRQEPGDCTSRVVFADLQASAALPAYEYTTVRIQPDTARSFGFACGMNMIHGTLVAEPAELPVSAGSTTGDTIRPALTGDWMTAPAAGESAGGDAEAGQAAERRAEISDLTRRVIVGAVLTRAGAVRGDDPFRRRQSGPSDSAQSLAAAGLDHPGDVLHRLVHPPHRPGSHCATRAADMNSLITLITVITLITLDTLAA
jgi:Cu+-exporting ATPase